MSKYTTEVRFICEEAAGLRESVGYEDVNEVVTKAYPKIFDSSLNFYNEETKTRLLPKILIHYYQKEIGFETVGLWKLKLNQRLREILPYYNQLYASEDIEYNPLQNVDNTHTHKGEYENSKENTNIRTDNLTETRDLTTVDDGSASYDRNEDTILRHDKTTTRGDDVRYKDADTVAQGNDVNTHEVDAALDHWTMFSDTPQGGINGVQLAGGVSQSGTLSDNAYLTTATHVTESPAATHDTIQHGTITNSFGNETQEHGDIVETFNKGGDKSDHVDADGWEKTDNINTHKGTVKNTGGVTNEFNQGDNGSDKYEKHEHGKIGVITYQEMVMKWREAFLNIDMMIINELDDLFMKVW